MVTKAVAFPSRFWKAADLPPGGLVLKIAKSQLEKVGQDQKEKYCLYFKGQDKQLVVNSTNWDLIADFCGADSDIWPGKDVVLVPDKTPFGAKGMVDCIRVRKPPEPRPQMTQAKPPQNRPPAMARPVQPEPPLQYEDGDPGWTEDAIQDFRH